MAGEVVQVRFGADASGAVAGGAEVKGVLAGLGEAVAALKAQLAGLGEGATAAFREMGAGAKTAAVEVKAASEEMRAFAGLLSGLSEAILAVFAVGAIVDFAKHLGEAAEQTIHTAETFGLAATEVQELKATAAGLGVPFEAF